MINQAFVTACRGPQDTPADINPLSWLHSAIAALGDLEYAIAERDEDPDAYWMMVRELEGLHAGLTAALAEQDAAISQRARAEDEIDSLYGNTATGGKLLHGIIEEHGIGALTNEAIIALRDLHVEVDRS